MTTANLPATIEVGPFTYTVTTDRTDVLEECHERDARLLGHTDNNTLAIWIAPDYPAGAKRDTILHETLHAILHVTHLDADIEDDEAFVRRLTPPLLDLLRSNPELVAYLTAA
jgi:hypothetical protein